MHFFFFLNIGFSNHLNIGNFSQLKLYGSYVFLLFEYIVSNFYSIKLYFLTQSGMGFTEAL